MHLAQVHTAYWRTGCWSIWGAALLMCLLGVPSRAMAAPDDRRSPAVPVHADLAGAAPARPTRVKSGRAFDRMSPQARTPPGTIAKGRHSAPANLRGMHAGAAGNAIPVPPMAAPARNYLTGVPHVQTSGRLGGAAVRRTNHGAVIDNTQLRRKF